MFTSFNYNLIVFKFHTNSNPFLLFSMNQGFLRKPLTTTKTSALELKKERAMLLEEWLNMEGSFRELGDISLVLAKLPKRLKKRRQMVSDRLGMLINL